jgi:uncharacterized Ntn-hydrolase superfamily protein
MEIMQAPPRQEAQNGQQPRARRKTAAAALGDNELKTAEDMALYLNTARTALFEHAVEMDALAAEMHSAAVVLRKRLLKAVKAKAAGGMRDKYAAAVMVRRSVRPLFSAARASAGSGHDASSAAKLLRRFWKAYQMVTEDLVPPRRGERK